MNNEKTVSDDVDLLINSLKSILIFIIKTIIVSFAIIISLIIFIPDIPRIPETEENKLILLSFIQNPYVLWRLSELEELKGRKENAIKYMEAAIGLMEMNNASEKTIIKYRERMIILNK